MGFQLLQTSAILFLTLVRSLVAIDPAVYFKSQLPNTPIPQPIIDSILTRDMTKNLYVLDMPNPLLYKYRFVESDEDIEALNMTSPLFLENDIFLGKMLKVHFGKDTTPPPFLPRQVSNLMPFTLGKLDAICKAFSVNPGSVEAKLIEETIRMCEKASSQGENEHIQSQYCATSLESIADFISSKLGKRVKTISSKVDGNEGETLQEYKVTRVKRLAINNAIFCHHQYYPYAIYYCHKSENIKTYMISLIGQNNRSANVVTVCHEPGPWRNLVWVKGRHLSFQLLNQLRGKEFICHFVNEDEIVWVPY